MQTAVATDPSAGEVITDDARWAAVLRRDPKADGFFYYGVLTTGVYCRPSCASRMARRENVAFYSDCAAAERAGYRPCKRCKPNAAARSEQYRAKVMDICRKIETADETLTLDALAQAVGMSRFHFHRVFKSVTGLTPKAYAAAHRARRLREQLARGKKVTDAMYDSGFNSSGQLYASSSALLGMTPSEFRKGGTNAVMRFAIGECSLGSVLVAATDKGVCAILLGSDPDALLRDLQDRFSRAELLGGDEEFERTVAAVIGHIEAPSRKLDLQLDIRGTVFQQRVWQALREIPFGSTSSYSEIARRVDSPKAVRAVAQACAANAIAIAIPCHRVVRNDGALSGYRWGVERKRTLLERERQAIEN